MEKIKFVLLMTFMSLFSVELGISIAEFFEENTLIGEVLGFIFPSLCLLWIRFEVWYDEENKQG